MPKSLLSVLHKHSTILILFLVGLLIRFLLMPWTMHADLLSMSYRAHLMAEYGIWQLPTNQYLAHLLYAFNLLGMKLFGFNLLEIFPQQFGLSVGSLTSSVGDWLTFNEGSQVNAVVFFLKLPHLIADVLVFWLLAKIFPKKHQLLAVSLWWFNPVNLYAFYIFARHDVLTALVLLLAMLFAARDKIWPALVSVYAGIQIRVVPLMLLPVFVVDLWKHRTNLQRLTKHALIAAGVIVLYVFLVRLLPAKTELLDSILGRESQAVWQVPAVGVPGRLANQAVDTSVGGVPVFLALYALLGGLFFFFAKKVQSQDRLEYLNALLLMVMALYFAINPFSPHYFVWLSLFATLGVGFWPKLLWPYAGAVLGWMMMGAFASDSFAITQNLFVPVSTSLFRTPQLHTIVAQRGVDSQLLFTFGRVILSSSLVFLTSMVFVKQFWQRLDFSLAQVKKAILPLLLAASLSLVPTKAQALTAPVIEVKDSTQAILLLPGTTVGQTFVSPVDSFGSIEIRLQTDRVPGQQNLIFRLKEVQQSNWLYEAEYDRNDFYNKYYYPFGFPLVTGAYGKEYYVEVSLAEAEQTYPLKVLVNADNPYTEGSLVLNGEPVRESDISFVVLADDTSLFIQQLQETLHTKFEQQRVFFIGYAVLLFATTAALGYLILLRLLSRTK